MTRTAKTAKTAKPATFLIATIEGLHAVPLEAARGAFAVHRVSWEGRPVQLVKEWRVSCLETGCFLGRFSAKAAALEAATELAAAVDETLWRATARALKEGRALTAEQLAVRDQVACIMRSFTVTLTVYAPHPNSEMVTAGGDPMKRTYVSGVTLPQLVRQYPRLARRLLEAFGEHASADHALNSVAVGTVAGGAAGYAELLLGLRRELSRRDARVSRELAKLRKLPGLPAAAEEAAAPQAVAS